VTFAAGESIDLKRSLPARSGWDCRIILVYLLANVAYLAALGPMRWLRRSGLPRMP
jgi:hypothetical protein